MTDKSESMTEDEPTHHDDDVGLAVSVHDMTSRRLIICPRRRTCTLHAVGKRSMSDRQAPARLCLEQTSRALQ